MVILQCGFCGATWNFAVDCDKDSFDSELFKKLFHTELSNQEAVMKILDPNRIGVDFGESENAMQRALFDMGVKNTNAQFIEVNL